MDTRRITVEVQTDDAGMARILENARAKEAAANGKPQQARCSVAEGSAMDMLRELLRADSNLLLWRSWPDNKKHLFYVWSTKCGEGLADHGEPTLEEAIAKFYRDHRHQLSPNK